MLSHTFNEFCAKTKIGRRNTGFFFKSGGEVIAVRKAAHRSNLGNTQAAGHQQPFCLVDSKTVDIFFYRSIAVLLK